LPSRGSGLDCHQRKEEDELSMKAAVLRTLGKPPRFEEFPDPKPSQGEVIVHVKAASLKNIDKMMARGSHYDSHRELPVVCGSDGVGTLDDGTRVFCGGSRPPYGMMADSASIPSKLRSPTWKPLGNGKTYLVADSLLSRKRLPGGKNVFYNK
jgi:NADPH:quinone reductase-like Zn-dependent oxidoreductase